MAKKAQPKTVKKLIKKVSAKPAKNAVQENIAAKTIVAAETIVTAETTVAQSAAVQAEPIQEAKMCAEEKKEESKMADEEKRFGKSYNPNEFSQPAAEAGSGGSSKVFLYAGIGVAVLAVIVAGLFFFGGFQKGSNDNLTGATVITAYCTDTDGGYNRFTKGVAEGTYYLNYEEGKYMDTCAANDANKLTEYYCKGDLVVYATEPCAEGMACQDGICVEEQ